MLEAPVLVANLVCVAHGCVANFGCPSDSDVPLIG
jgi:hypothetical protein